MDFVNKFLSFFLSFFFFFLRTFIFDVFHNSLQDFSYMLVVGIALYIKCRVKEGFPLVGKVRT